MKMLHFKIIILYLEDRTGGVVIYLKLCNGRAFVTATVDLMLEFHFINLSFYNPSQLIGYLVNILILQTSEFLMIFENCDLTIACINKTEISDLS